MITHTTLTSPHGAGNCWQQVKAFLTAVHGEDANIYWQTLDDSKSGKKLTNEWCAPLNSKTIQQLQQLNQQGAGIYHTVNRTDGKGRKATNVLGINALFCDFDKGEPENLDQLPPVSAVIQSKNGKHLYWFLQPDQPLDQFTAYQKMLISMTGEFVDKSIHDLPRILRMPGFNHMKNPSDPFMVQLVELHPERRYNLSDFPTPSKLALASSKKKGNTSAVNVANGLKGLEDVLTQYRAIVTANGIPDWRVAALEKKTKSKLNQVKLGNGADNAILSASIPCSELLTRTESSVEQVVEQVLAWAGSVYQPQDTGKGTRWNSAKAKATVINGLRYGVANKLQELEPEKFDIEGAKRVNSQYVAGMGIDYKAAKLTGIQSCIGTGKTWFIKQTIQSILETSPSYPVRIFCHRTALVDQWVGELQGCGFIAYNDNEVIKCVNDVFNISLYISTYDSLERFAGKVPQGHAGLIVLDEIDQALHYLFLCRETTIASQRRVCWDVLKMFCQKAEHVIAASATMSQDDADTLVKLCSWKNQPVTSQYFINEQKPKQKKFIRLSSVDEAINKIRDLVAQGKNVYVPTDSANQTEVYQLMVEVNSALASARITAKTKGEYDLSEINSTLEQYQVVFASPTLGTGVDINNSHFHAVVGIFKNANDLTYMDCKQAVGRVRYPIDNEVYVYMDETYRWFETDPEALADRFDVHSNAVAPFITGMRLNDTQDAWVYDRHEDYDFIQDQQVKRLVRQESGKGARGHKFWQSVEADGHEVVNSALYNLVGHNWRVSDELKEVAICVKENNAHKVATSPVLTQEQVGELQKRAQQVGRGKKALTEQEQNALTRYFISCAIYPEAEGEAVITSDEVLWYNKSGKKTISALRTLRLGHEAGLAKDKDIAEWLQVDGGYDSKYYARNNQYWTRLLTALVPVVAAGSYRVADLAGFMAVVRDIGADEVRKLGVKVKMTEPTTTANSVLALMEWEVEAKQARLKAVVPPSLNVSKEEDKVGGTKQETKVKERIYHISRTDWQTRLITSYATDETRALLGLPQLAETEPEDAEIVSDVPEADLEWCSVS